MFIFFFFSGIYSLFFPFLLSRSVQITFSEKAKWSKAHLPLIQIRNGSSNVCMWYEYNQLFLSSVLLVMFALRYWASVVHVLFLCVTQTFFFFAFLIFQFNVACSHNNPCSFCQSIFWSGIQQIKVCENKERNVVQFNRNVNDRHRSMNEKLYAVQMVESIEFLSMKAFSPRIWWIKPLIHSWTLNELMIDKKKNFYPNVDELIKTLVNAFSFRHELMFDY